MTLFKLLAPFQSEISWYVKDVVYCINLCPKIPSKEFWVCQMLSAKECY